MWVWTGLGAALLAVVVIIALGVTPKKQPLLKGSMPPPSSSTGH